MEDIVKNAAKKQVFGFGLAGFLIFGAAAGLALVKGSLWGMTILGGLAAAMGLIAVAPGPMTPLYKLWMKIALLMGHVVNSIVLTILFVLLIIPFGLARRIARPEKPLMPSGPDKAAHSYWKPRQNFAQEKSRFTRRY